MLVLYDNRARRPWVDDSFKIRRGARPRRFVALGNCIVEQFKVKPDRLIEAIGEGFAPIGGDVCGDRLGGSKRSDFEGCADCSDRTLSTIDTASLGDRIDRFDGGKIGRGACLNGSKRRKIDNKAVDRARLSFNSSSCEFVRFRVSEGACRPRRVADMMVRLFHRTLNRPIRSGLWIVVAIATVFTASTERDRAADRLAFDVFIREDIVYRQAGARSPTLDVYSPRDYSARSKRPVIVAFHGGCWIGGDKREHTSWFLPMTARGFVLIGVNYRLARARDRSWPESCGDARGAIRWVRSHARELGIDPERIVAAGTDSGGWLAELLAVDPDGDDPGRNPPVSARVSAAVAFSASSDLAALARESRGAARSIGFLLGGSVDRFDQRAREASPALKATPSASPLLLIHGSDDAFIPPDQSRRMRLALAKAGVLCRVEIVPGARHGFGPIVDGRDFFPLMLEFLDRVWNDKSPLAETIDPIAIDRLCGFSSFVCSRSFGNESIRAGLVVFSLRDRGPRLNMKVFQCGSGARASTSGGFIIG